MRKANYYFSFSCVFVRENRVHLYGFQLNKRKSNSYDRTFPALFCTNVQTYKFGILCARFKMRDKTKFAQANKLIIRVKGAGVQKFALNTAYWTSSK